MLKTTVWVRYTFPNRESGKYNFANIRAKKLLNRMLGYTSYRLNDYVPKEDVSSHWILDD